LQLNRIARNPHFEFFRYAASEHLSADGRRSDPWLSTAYRSLREIALSSPQTMSISADDLASVVARAGTEVDSNDLIATASRANFLSISDDGLVRPRIPILARIAASAMQREGN
jgi:hypothetical protein